MTWLFAEVWVWSIAAFLVGALLTYLLFVRPLRRRLDDALDELYAESHYYPEPDYAGSGYYSDTSDSLPVAEHPVWAGPDSLSRRELEDEPTFGDWERSRSWSPTPDEDVHDAPQQTGLDWDGGQPGISFGDARSIPHAAPFPAPEGAVPPPDAQVPPAAAGSPSGLTERFGAPGGSAAPTGSGMAPTAGGSGSSWFQSEDTQALTPEGHADGPDRHQGGSDAHTEMFRPMNGAAPGEPAPMPPPVGQESTPPDEGHTEMFRPVDDTVVPSPTDSGAGRSEGGPTGQLRSLFEPLTDNDTPTPPPVAPEPATPESVAPEPATPESVAPEPATPDPTVVETTQHIPRIDANPEPQQTPEAQRQYEGSATEAVEGTSAAEHRESVPASDELTQDSADPTVTHQLPGSADPGSAPLPRRKPGAGPRPGAQNLNRNSDEPDQAAEQDTYTIKGHFASRQYHTPESPQYERVIAEVWFRTRAEAEQAGFEPWDGNRAS